ncbi:hypothetical protein HYV70_02145 [Candidatus Uhrbacteria bacterium]|nr:hypothetical protein [Candidatus Uhrbacteria bacterium]
MVKYEFETPEQNIARKIMGGNFYGIPEIEKSIGWSSDVQERQLGLIPYSEEQLRTCSQSHVLVAVIPRSLLFFQSMLKHLFVHPDHEWTDRTFLANFGSIGWLLVSKTAQTQKPFQAPDIRELTCVMIATFLSKGEKLFPEGHPVLSSTKAADRETYAAVRWKEDRLIYSWEELREGTLFAGCVRSFSRSADKLA